MWDISSDALLFDICSVRLRPARCVERRMWWRHWNMWVSRQRHRWQVWRLFASALRTVHRSVTASSSSSSSQQLTINYVVDTWPLTEFEVDHTVTSPRWHWCIQLTKRNYHHHQQQQQHHRYHHKHRLWVWHSQCALYKCSALLYFYVVVTNYEVDHTVTSRRWHWCIQVSGKHSDYVVYGRFPERRFPGKSFSRKNSVSLF